jgi:hypothetical protein
MMTLLKLQTSFPIELRLMFWVDGRSQNYSEA